MNSEDEAKNTGEREYLTIDEAAEEIGWTRVTVFQWVKALEIEKRKFFRNKKTHISLKNADRLKLIKEKPWLADSIKEEIAQENKERQEKEAKKNPEDPAA